MSSRVTRASAKKSAENLSSNKTQQSPPTQPSTSRKRKAIARSPSLENLETTAQSTGRSKKRPRTDPAEPEEPSSSLDSKPKRRAKSRAAMSDPKTDQSKSATHDENAAITPTTSDSSSRKKLGKDKNDTPLDSHSSGSKYTKPSTSKRRPSKRDTDAKSTAALPPPPPPQGPDRDDDDSDNEEDQEHDDPMDEDPFEASGLFGQSGSTPGLAGTLRALSGIMSGMTSKLRALLEQLRSDDPSDQFIALGHLSEILLVSTEDNLAGHFSPDQYVKEFVKLMQEPEDGSEGNQEMMLTACRCIANLIEALPAATATVVYTGAVPVLVSKLLTIEYMDLAEQALTTLEKISLEFPSSIVREGGLSACLQFLDFFPTGTQRTAVTTAANCCRNIPESSFDTVKDVMPNLLSVLNGSDQRVVEQGCLCISRIAESFKNQHEKLEELISPELLSAILRLLSPSSTNIVGHHIHTQFLRVLSYVARASPVLTVELFNMNVVDTLYQILTGVSPPSGDEDVAQKIDSVVVMQALIHRPRDQVFETLNVICQLLPGLEHIDLDALSKPDPTSFKSVKQPPSKRLEMLSNCKAALKRFAVILLPTLTDAYSSTVNLSVRQKVLDAQLKMLANIEADILEDALKAVPYASFLASILSQQDHEVLVKAALQAAGLLLKRLGPVYGYQFYREGVIAEVCKLAERKSLSTADNTVYDAGPKTPENASSDAEQKAGDDASLSSPTQESASVAEDIELSEQDEEPEPDEEDEDYVEAARQRIIADTPSSATSSPQPQTPTTSPSRDFDSTTNLAKKFVAMYETDTGNEFREKSTKMLKDLHELVVSISDCYEDARIEEGTQHFAKLAKFFEGDALESITSYELLTSKVVSTLLEVFEDPHVHNDAKAAFVEVFMGSTMQQKIKVTSGDTPATPFSMLVNKLQDLLSRAEHFEVNTVHSQASESNRSSAASMLAKQIRINLVAGDNSDIPLGFRSIRVSIHAIATFKALDDYLRPRISMTERPRGGRHSASYAAAMAGLGSNSLSTSRAFTEAQSQPSSTAKASLNRGSRRKSKNSEAAADAVEQPTPNVPTETPTVRRHSRRSKTKQSSTISPAVTQQSEDNLRDALECADENQLSDEDADMDAGGLSAVLDQFDEDMDDENDQTIDPTAVNMEIASTGKVTARKEDGTRISTPTQPTGTSRFSEASRLMFGEQAQSMLAMPGRGMSYAAAVQATPTDWHLEFSVNGQPLSNDTTIYRAVHSSQINSDESSVRGIWSNIHNINFKRVAGPPPTNPLSPSPTSNTDDSELPQSLARHPTTATILRLLRILHEINANLDDVLSDERSVKQIKAEPLKNFVNTKLTAKMNRQLEEPLIVASNCLPSWSEDLARLYPFLFPFETRHLFLRSTSFGYSRSMARWQSNQSQGDSRRDRYRDERQFMGRVQRQKVRISRSRILESAVKVMDLYGASPSILEVEFFEEVGTGLGPTLEFYSNVSKEFSRKKLKLWRENEADEKDQYAFGKHGLFPAPYSEAELRDENGQKVLSNFKTLGKFVARSMLDSRIIDLSFNPTFFRINSGADAIVPSLGALRIVDNDLAKSLHMLKQFATAKKKIDEQSRLTNAQKAQKISGIRVADACIDDLELFFTMPGYNIDLVENGSNVKVTIDTVGLYIEKVLEVTLGTGVERQVEAFRTGFSQVFPYSALKAFTPDELVMLFGRIEEDWSMETLMDSIKADHGYNLDSPTVRNLLQSLTELDQQSKRDFLQFVTGSAKLPIGGFKALTPMFTVVLRPSEPGHVADEYLPSCMTCVNYLKMPDYSTLDVMRMKLNIAIKEGQGAFHLS